MTNENRPVCCERQMNIHNKKIMSGHNTGIQYQCPKCGSTKYIVNKRETAAINVYSKMNSSEIWEGWCGSASTLSDEGQFVSIEEVSEYICDRMRDWGNEKLDDDRTISEMTPDEIDAVVNAIWAYSQEPK